MRECGGEGGEGEANVRECGERGEAGGICISPLSSRCERVWECVWWGEGRDLVSRQQVWMVCLSEYCMMLTSAAFCSCQL